MTPYRVVELLLLGFFTGAIVYASNAAAQPNDIFVIAVGTNGEGFEDDSGIAAGGGEVGGDVIVYINGNPVIDYQSGGVFKQVNQYIRNGANSVRLEGRADRNLYVKVGLMAGPEFKQVMAKKAFSPADVTAGGELLFSADVDYLMPMLERSNRIPEGVGARAVYPLLRQLETYLADSDYEQAAALLLSQMVLWGEQAYGQEKEQLEQMQQQAAAYYRENAFTYHPPSPDSIKVIQGESVLLVYSGVDDNGFFKTKTLGEFIANGSKKIPAPAMRLVFTDGQWRIWE